MHNSEDINLTADFYRIFGSPETVSASRVLGWAEKLRLLGLWRAQTHTDMASGAIDEARGAAVLAEVNAAMRRAAGKAFSPEQPAPRRKQAS